MWKYLHNLVTRKFSATIVLFFATVLARWNIFPNQFINDDFDYIVNWPLIQDMGNWPRFFFGYVPPDGQGGVYSPLKTLIHAINYRFFGLDVWGYHAESILMHVLGVICVYFIFRFLMRAENGMKEPIIPFLAAFVFAVHPVQVELTVSMTGAVDLIGVVFMLASVLFYLYYINETQNGRSWYLLSLLMCILAIFTHELVVTFPVLLLWCDLFYRRVKRSWGGRGLALAPFFGISCFYVYCKWAALGAVSRNTYLYDSFYLTMLVTLKALGKYVLISLFPFILTHNHEISPGIFSFSHGDFDRVAVWSQSLFDIYSMMSLLIIGLVIWGAKAVWPRYRFVAFAAGWFFLGLLPGLNIVPSGVYFAERYLYPGFGAFCIVLAWLIVLGWQRYGAGQDIKDKIFVFLVCALFCFYYVRSWTRIPDMRNDITAFESAVRAAPRSALMRNDLGIIYADYGYPELAIQSFQKALLIREDPETYFAMADAYTRLGRHIKTVESLEKAVALRPDYPEALFNLASVYFYMGEVDKAQKSFSDSMRLLKAHGRYEDAAQYEKTWKEFIEAEGI